ncbi:GIY-YIG nuclease family protein [Vibrio parahaemolyticus]
MHQFPFSFNVHAMIYSEDAPALENDLHKRFDFQSINRLS